MPLTMISIGRIAVVVVANYCFTVISVAISFNFLGIARKTLLSLPDVASMASF
jgi:hypothetical protein